MQTSVEPVPGNASEQDPRDLIRRILRRYHASHRRDLPRLCALARKVESRHADDPRAPLGLAEQLQELRSELEEQMRREERTLFPSILGDLGRLDTQLAEIRGAHSGQAARLRRIARLTNGFTPPEGACPEWWALYAMAFSFVDDLEEHIHLEDDVLFPRYERRPC